MTLRNRSVSFDDSDTRFDEMHEQIHAWIADLTDLRDEAAASDEFQEWLDVQSRFHEYSYRNTILIKRQCPEATRVAGYRTWQEEFDRQVMKGEKAIWIWAPIITKQCPDCGNSPSFHEHSDCAFDESPPDEWSTGLVGFKPAAVYDVSQTEGDPLPALETDAVGESPGPFPSLIEGAEELGVDVRIVPADEWTFGAAKGVCTDRRSQGLPPLIEVRDRENEADLTVTLLHECAHALLHVEADDVTERAKRELEAEAVAYIVGRYLGLDPKGSGFYLAAWCSDGAEIVGERLARISRTAEEIITVITS